MAIKVKYKQECVCFLQKAIQHYFVLEMNLNLIDYFLNEGEKGYKEGHEHEEGKKGHHDKVLKKKKVV